MERNREGRRGSMAASATTMNGGGPSRRRQKRSSNLRVSPEDDDGGGRMEMYRSSSRSKKRRTRRGERLVSNRDDGDGSSEESLGEDEEDDDFVRFPTTTSSSVTNQPPPASSSSSSMHQQQNQYHRARRSSSSKPTRPPAPLSWSVAEELIGVPIPRRARSSSLKRSQETIGGGGRGGELLMHRRQSSTSPSSSNASVREQKPISGPKHRQPEISKPSSSIQEIEIEVAEVLFGMTRQSPLSSSSRQESPHKLDLQDVNGWSTEAKSGTSSPAGSLSPPPATSQSQPPILRSQNLDSSANSVTAPKMKRPRLQSEKESLATRIKMELLPPKADEGLASASASPSRQEKKMAEVSRAVGNDSIAGSHLQESATQENSNSAPERKEAEDKTTASKSTEASCSNLDEATANKAPREEKFSIDLMAPPPRENSEREGLSEYLEPVKKLDIMNGEIEKPDKSLKQEATTTSTTEFSSAGQERNAGKCMANDVHSKDKFTTEEKQILEHDLDLEKKDKDCLSLCGSSRGQQQTKQQREELRPDPKPSDKNGPSIVSAHPASLQLTMPIAGWPGNFPHFGYMGQVPPLPAFLPMDGRSVTSKTLQPPHFFPTQKRKRCATHCYIAQAIHYNQQIARMNPFWPPAAAGTLPIYGANPCNLNVMLQSETAILGNLLQGSFPGRSLGQLQDKVASPAVATYAGASAKEKSATAAATNSTLMEAQRKQFLLQQTSCPASAAAAAAPHNMLHGPAFIFPTAQQPAAATSSMAAKSKQGICNPYPPAASVSSIGAGSVPSGHPVSTMSFNYPTLPTNDAQYLAFLQNNGYPFPTPTHPARAMPFFTGSSYSSLLLHSQQQPQQQQPSNQQQHPALSQQGHHNPSTSSGSSSFQEHHSQQSQRPPGGAGAAAAPAGGNSHSFPASKEHLQLLPPETRQPEREAACKDSPSPADSTRTSQAQKSMYGKFAMSVHPQNFALINPASAALPSNGAGGSGCHKEKQQPQQNQANLTPSHANAMSFAAAAASGGPPGIDFSSMVQNHAFFQSLPEAARHHGYQQIAAATAAAAQAAQHKKSHHEDGKSGGDPGTVNANVSCEEGKLMISTSKVPRSSGQHSVIFSRPDHDHTVSTLPVNSSCSTEGPSRNANLMQLLANGGRTSNLSSIAAPPSSSAAVTAGIPANPALGSLNMQLPQQQQLQQLFQLQKQQLQFLQQMLSRDTKKTSSRSTDNEIVYSDRMPSGSTMTRFPQGTGFPPSVIQGASAGQSPQWKASGRAVAPGPANSAASSSSSVKNQQLPQQQQQQQQHQGRNHQQQQQQQQALLSSNVRQTQISFGSNLSKTVVVSGQTHLAGGSSNSSSPSVAAMAAGSRQKSVLKSGDGNGGSAGGNGSPGASTSSKSGPAATASLLQAALPTQQPTPAAKNSPSSSSPNLKPPPASNWNMNSILGRPNGTPASTNSSSTTKFQQPSQQQQQQQRLQQKQSSHQPQPFFSNSSIQAAQSSQSNAAFTKFANFYQLQLQQQQQSQQQNSLGTSSSLTLASSSATTSDPAKAAAAAAAGGMKGLTPVSGAPGAFPCVHAISSSVSVKPSADQKAAAAPGN